MIAHQMPRLATALLVGFGVLVVAMSWWQVAMVSSLAMIDMLFQTQRQWAGAKDPLEALSKAGRLLGIDDVKFRACQDDKAAFAAIIAERQGGESSGVESTPTIFIDGKPYPGVRPIDDYRKIIDPLLE